MRTAAVAIPLGACVLAGACGPTTRLVVEPTPAALQQSKRSVVVVKFSMPAEPCRQHFMLLGVREGNGHRLVKRLQAGASAQAGSANAAEAELDPGEYHMLGYVCVRARSIIKIGSEGGPHTLSLASFTLEPGEVVNVGHITMRRLWGKQEVTISVRDWSLEDLKRFKDERPNLYSGLRTRLIAVRGSTPVAAEERDERCAELLALKAEGKVQAMPKGCG